LRALTKKVGLSQKEVSDLTENWIFGIPSSIDCICSSTVALYIISMKELTLINRYPQTQERPKPPVEQRVKVIRRSQTQTGGSRTLTRETGPDRQRNFGKRTKSNEGQGTTLDEKKMKSSPDISLNEKVELKYKGETVQGSNVVDLVNNVSINIP
jgi:hypothetical protein